MRSTMDIPEKWTNKAPQLRTIAKWINENTTLVADIEQGYSSTDRKITGTRLISPGKGRRGTRLKVWTNAQHRRAGLFVSTAEEKKLREKYGRYPLLDHNSAETYRTNSEVVEWLDRYLKDHPEVMR